MSEFATFYHSLRSDHIAAHKYYYEALGYLSKHNLEEHKITILQYIFLSGTHEKLDNPQQALQYLLEGEKLARKLNYKQVLISIWTNFGDHYSNQKNYALASQYYDSALVEANRSWDADWDPNILIAALIGRDSTLIEMNKPQLAISYLNRAQRVAETNQIIYSEIAAKIELGATYNKLGRSAETVQMLIQVLPEQDNRSNWYKEEGYQVLLDAYEKLGKYKEALAYQRKLNKLQDSLMNTEKTVSLNELELKLQTVNKDKDLSSKQLLIEKQKNNSRTKTH